MSRFNKPAHPRVGSGKRTVYRSVSPLFAMGVGLLATAASGCPEGPQYASYSCALEGQHSIGPVCLDTTDAELRHLACTAKCNNMQEELPGDHPIHGYDCDDAVGTHNPAASPCPHTVDWVEEIQDDPDNGVKRTFNCQIPYDSWWCNEDTNGDGITTANEGTLLTFGPSELQVCADGIDEAHGPCIQECRDFLLGLNAWHGWTNTNCAFDPNVCALSGLPREVDGQVCGFKGLVSSGDHAENVVWSDKGGLPSRRPTDCSLSGDCCRGFGAAACASLQSPVRSAPVADRRSTLSGRLIIEQPNGETMRLAVKAQLASAFKRGAAATAPVYIEELTVRAGAAPSAIEFAGETVALDTLTVRLDRPTLAVADTRTGEFKLLHDRAPLRVQGAARQLGTRASLPIDQELILPQDLTGRLDRRGGLVELHGSTKLASLGIRLTLQLTKNGAKP